MVDLPTETPTLLSESGFYPLWSPDGAVVTYGSIRNRSCDLYRIPVNLSRSEELTLDTENNLRTADMAPDGALVAAISGDGRWMAFVSDLSGQDEVYVTSFPKPKG